MIDGFLSGFPEEGLKCITIVITPECGRKSDDRTTNEQYCGRRHGSRTTTQKKKDANRQSNSQSIANCLEGTVECRLQEWYGKARTGVLFPYPQVKQIIVRPSSVLARRQHIIYPRTSIIAQLKCEYVQPNMHLPQYSSADYEESFRATGGEVDPSPWKTW